MYYFLLLVFLCCSFYCQKFTVHIIILINCNDMIWPGYLSKRLRLFMPNYFGSLLDDIFLINPIVTSIYVNVTFFETYGIFLFKMYGTNILFSC